MQNPRAPRSRDGDAARKRSERVRFRARLFSASRAGSLADPLSGSAPCHYHGIRVFCGSCKSSAGSADNNTASFCVFTLLLLPCR
eukprot:495180-Pyramimonas_sp.AAC.1